MAKVSETRLGLVSRHLDPRPMDSPATRNHGKYERRSTQPENPFAHLVPDLSIAIVPAFTLESGVTLRNVPVAYKTWGRLAPAGDNAMVVCHALTGSSDVADWWGPLLGGDGKALDLSRFYIVCLNSLGSPYGSASPVTSKNGDPAQGHYGPEFPLTTIRDDVNIFKLVLDDLGVRQIATVVGGSMGGAVVLEFAYFGKDYVRTIIPIATSARYSAWGISWSETQRQSIYSDPKYGDGYYSFDDPPSTGLGAARMAALLTYRSRDSFEVRFGRNVPDPARHKDINGPQRSPSPGTIENEHWAIHNDGNKNAASPKRKAAQSKSESLDPEFTGSPGSSRPEKNRTPTYFSAQSYLRYQGDKFIQRFDANCYIAITRKLDTHDVGRNRGGTASDGSSAAQRLRRALSQIEQPTLVLGIQSDGLFTFAEQEQLAAAVPRARLRTIDSSEGHDAFLLEFEQVNAHLLAFMREELADVMAREPDREAVAAHARGKAGGKASVGEVDDITAW